MNRPAISQQVTFLYTVNLAASSYFYADVLGLPLVLDQGDCRIYRAGGDAFIGLCEREQASTQPEGVILTLISDQVDEWYRYLQGHKVHFDQPPTHNATYNIYHCFLRDPNGYLIEIQTFLDPNWPRLQACTDPAQDASIAGQNEADRGNK